MSNGSDVQFVFSSTAKKRDKLAALIKKMSSHISRGKSRPSHVAIGPMVGHSM